MREVSRSNPGILPLLHACSKHDGLPCWLAIDQQVSHHRGIWGSHKWENTQGIHPGFETQGKHHQNSKTGVSVAPQKGLMSTKLFFNIINLNKRDHVALSHLEWQLGRWFLLPTYWHQLQYNWSNVIARVFPEFSWKQASTLCRMREEIVRLFF